MNILQSAAPHTWVTHFFFFFFSNDRLTTGGGAQQAAETLSLPNGRRLFPASDF